MEMNYKAKIKKLLALAESPVEAEAQAALLKSRELMAKHKLSERDLKDVGKREVKDIELEITCSKRRDPWIVNLSGVIAENYCCKGYRRHSPGSQTQRMGFIGFEDDVEICVVVFKYAVDCVLAKIKEIKKEYKQYGLQADYIKRMCDSYGYGFVSGANKAFKKQQEEKQQEWGLVLVILSRLVDTFISRISLTMLPVPNPHNTVCVLSWEEARHWQSRSSGYSSS